MLIEEVSYEKPHADNPLACSGVGGVASTTTPRRSSLCYTRMLKLAYFVTLALTAAGCGKQVLVPENTSVAGYVNLEKAYASGNDVVKMLIGALPDDMRKKAQKQYEESLREIDKYKERLAPKWAVVAFGDDWERLPRSYDEENGFAVTIRINADEDAVRETLKDTFKMEVAATKMKSGNIVFETGRNDHWGLVKGKYLIFSPKKDAFDEMFALYAGESKASNGFDDLSDLAGETVCRISLASVSTMLEREDLKREFMKFKEACGDKELADLILNMGSISVDFDVGSELRLSLHANCGSSSDAKTVEKLLRGVVTLARLGCAIGAYVAGIAKEKMGKQGVSKDDDTDAENESIDFAQEVCNEELQAKERSTRYGSIWTWKKSKGLPNHYGDVHAGVMVYGAIRAFFDPVASVISADGLGKQISTRKKRRRYVYEG